MNHDDLRISKFVHADKCLDYEKCTSRIIWWDLELISFIDVSPIFLWATQVFPVSKWFNNLHARLVMGKHAGLLWVSGSVGVTYILTQMGQTEPNLFSFDCLRFSGLVWFGFFCFTIWALKFWAEKYWLKIIKLTWIFLSIEDYLTFLHIWV